MTDYIFCFNEYSKARHLLLGSQKKGSTFHSNKRHGLEGNRIASPRSLKFQGLKIAHLQELKIFELPEDSLRYISDSIVSKRSERQKIHCGLC